MAQLSCLLLARPFAVSPRATRHVRTRGMREPWYTAVPVTMLTVFDCSEGYAVPIEHARVEGGDLHGDAQRTPGSEEETMAREKKGGRGGRDPARQSDREEQYGGINEQAREWTGQQRFGTGAPRGQDFGTGGTQQQHDPDLGRQFGRGGGEEGRADASGTGGHGSGSFGQSASSQGRNFGQGDYYQGQDYGEEFGQSGRSAQSGGRYGSPGYQGGSAAQGYQGSGYGQQGYQGGGYGPQSGQHGWQGTGFDRQGVGSGFSGESAGGYESGRQMGYVGRGPKGYRRSDDRIREDVSEELTRHPGVDASEIEVRVENGEVTLTGTVESRQAKRMAEDCVEQCSGVKEVHNQLRVNRQGSTQGSLESSQGAGQFEGRKQESEESRSRSSQTRGRS